MKFILLESCTTKLNSIFMFGTLISYMSFMVRKMVLNLPKSGFLTHKLQYQKYVRFLIMVNGLPNTLMA